MRSLQDILACIRDFDEYKELPPRGPSQDLPSVPDFVLDALQETAYGANLDLTTYAYHTLALAEDDPRPKFISLPTASLLDGCDIYAIDGSNQRADFAAFTYLMARAALVRFTYAKELTKSAFEVQHADLDGLLLIDGNLFEGVHLFTRTVGSDADSELLRLILDNDDKPMLWRYNPDLSNKLPHAQALGIAVKMQQSLELSMLRDIPREGRGLCIRDGPLFSTSVGPAETVEGLKPALRWKDRKLLAISKRVNESTLLIEALLQKTELRDAWFPGQEITDSTLKALSTDELLLPRILRPGERTPLFEAVGRARRAIVDQEPRLTPLATIYLSRHRPHTFIRIEIPKFIWEQSPEEAEDAISIAAWQHELGHSAPLIQRHADLQCQLQEQIQVAKHQFSSALARNKLAFPERYQ